MVRCTSACSIYCNCLHQITKSSSTCSNIRIYPTVRTFSLTSQLISVIQRKQKKFFCVRVDIIVWTCYCCGFLQMTRLCRLQRDGTWHLEAILEAPTNLLIIIIIINEPFRRSAGTARPTCDKYLPSECCYQARNLN